MKPHPHCRQPKPQILLTWAFLLLFFPFSSAHSPNSTESFPDQENNSSITPEYSQLKQPISKSSRKNVFLLNPERIHFDFLANDKSFFREDSIKESSSDIKKILTSDFKEARGNVQAARGLEEDNEIYSVRRDEPPFGDYELLEDPKEITVKRKCENFINKMWINFNPLRFKYFKSTDSIVYQIELSDNVQGFTSEKALGTFADEPYEIWLSLDHQEPIILLAYDVSESYYNNYYVRIKASVIREEQRMFSFTYPIGHKNIQPFRSIGIAAIGIVALVLVVVAAMFSYKGLKKVGKKCIEHNGFEDVRESPGLNENDDNA